MDDKLAASVRQTQRGGWEKSIDIDTRQAEERGKDKRRRTKI